MVFKKGNVPWNKGKTKETDSRVAKYVNTHVGKPSGALGKTWKWSDESRAKQSKRTMGRIPWNKGKTKDTDPRLAKMGRTLSKVIADSPRLLDIRSRNGKSNKGKPNWIAGLTKDTDPRVAKISSSLTGRAFSDEHRNNIRKMRLSQSPEERSRIGRIGGLASMAKLTPEEKSRRAIKARMGIPRSNTSIELLLQDRLDKHDILFNAQKSLLGVTIVDIFIPPNICVFADGNYWHNYPDGKERDGEQTKILEESGYKVLRFWGSEIRNNPEVCLSKILDAIKK